MLEWAAIWLRENAPAAPKISIVHGDFRIGNFLETGGHITAILDWELVRLGDPIEDLGWICLQAWRGRSPYMCHFFTREELRDRYAALTGTEVSLDAIRYWEAFGTYKLAVMHYGATHCFEARGFNDLRMAGMGAANPAHAAAGGIGDGACGMNVSLERLIEGIIATLRTDVIPNVSDAYARGQAVGVIDLLNNIGPRIEWARAPRGRADRRKTRTAAQGRRLAG